VTRQETKGVVVTPCSLHESNTFVFLCVCVCVCVCVYTCKHTHTLLHALEKRRMLVQETDRERESARARERERERERAREGERERDPLFDTLANEEDVAPWYRSFERFSNKVIIHACFGLGLCQGLACLGRGSED
jgi:hypothetical protein